MNISSAKWFIKTYYT